MRRREISPEFWTDEKVVQLTDGAKLLFIGIWALADREGRLEDRPIVIGLKIRAWDAASTPALLAELVSAGLVLRYEVDGKRLLGVPRFAQHQHCHPREMASKLPGWEGANRSEGEPKADLGGKLQAGSSGSSGPAGSSGSTGPSGSSGPSEVQGAPRRTRKAKAQAELPGLPPEQRPANELETLVAWWSEQRELKITSPLDAGGLAMPECPADDPVNWGQLGAVFGKWKREFGADAPKAILGSYLEETKWAGTKRKGADGKETDEPQPYPLRIALSEGVWSRIIDSFGSDSAGGVH